MIYITLSANSMEERDRSFKHSYKNTKTDQSRNLRTIIVDSKYLFFNQYPSKGLKLPNIIPIYKNGSKLLTCNSLYQFCQNLYFQMYTLFSKNIRKFGDCNTDSSLNTQQHINYTHFFYKKRRKSA